MSDVGAMVAELIAAGCAPEVAAKVVASAYVAGANSANFRGIPVDEVAEKRRAYDRERKRKSTGIPPESTGIPKLALVEDIDNKKVSGRGTRLPPEFQLPPEGREFAKQRGWSETQIDETFANFRDYWLAKPGSGGVKLDWLRTWQKWVRDTKIKPAGTAATPPPAEKIPIEQAVAMFAKSGIWSRHAPVNDISQVPVDLLAEHGLLPDGRKIQGASQ